MNKVVLYIKDTNGVYQAVDLFEDETISVTSKIQDIRDIAKVFTDFSQSFTLPASKKNNKIFRHFYNYFISEGAFDARKKVDAQLEVNYIPFREGKIFLNGVKMKDNKPFAYNITFFGNTVNLKDVLGDDELHQQNYSSFDHDYNPANVQTGITTGLFSESVIYPLITHTKRLYFNSNDNDQHTLQGNLAYINNSSHSRDVALDFTDLKPALKVSDILSAIEANERYNITFASGGANDFFDKDVLDNLYLWLSRTKGILGGAESAEEKVKVLEDWQIDSGTNFVSISSDGQEVFFTDANLGPNPYGRAAVNAYIIPETGYENIEYTFQMLYNGVVINEQKNITGNGYLNYQTPSLYINNVKFKFIVRSFQPFLFTTSLTMTDSTTYPIRSDNLSCGGVLSAQSRVLISEEMPKIKVIDFLSGLFKMFNLTAFYIEDRGDSNYGKIKVMGLDDFYNDNPKIFDITEYVDSTETDIEATIPFSEINFEYEEPQTLLMKRHQEDFYQTFGDEEFRPDGVDRGKPYEVKVPFEHFKFERLFDVNNNVKKDIQWGYSANDNFKPDSGASPQPTGNYEPILMKPSLFYGIRVTGLTSSSDGVNWNNGSHTWLQSYWKPSNTSDNGTYSDNPTETGTTTSTSADKLVDSGQNFLSTIEVGDVVFNSTDGTFANVTSVDSNSELTLDSDIMTSGEVYEIYHPPKYTLNFDDEVDEWNLTNYNGETNSLFKRQYKTYIEDAFNAKKRIFKLTAHLPSSILLNYKLNDRFQIGDKVFTINSIDTNLKTGESKLELLNVL